MNNDTNDMLIDLETIVNQITDDIINNSTLPQNLNTTTLLDNVINNRHFHNSISTTNLFAEEFLNNISSSYLYGPLFSHNINYDAESEKKNTITSKRFSEFSRGYSNKECSICFEINNDSVKLPCGHCFHEDCISKWLLEKSIHCPMCKFDCSVNKIDK